MNKISSICNDFYENGCYTVVNCATVSGSNLWLIVKWKLNFQNILLFDHIIQAIEY